MRFPRLLLCAPLAGLVVLPMALSGCAPRTDGSARHLEAASRLLRSGAHARAVDKIDAAIAAAPSSYDVYAAAVDLYRAREMYPEAASVADRAVHAAQTSRLKPSLSTEELAWLYVTAASLHQESRDLDRAEALYRNALSLAPSSPELLNALGYFYAEEGIKLDQAMKFTRRAVELAPDAAHIIDSLGWVQYKHGDYASAVSTLRRAVELMPDDPTLRYHLAASYAKLGQRLAAEIEARKSLLLGSDEREAVRALLKTLHR